MPGSLVDLLCALIPTYWNFHKTSDLTSLPLLANLLPIALLGQPARANVLRLRLHPLLYLVRACFGLLRQIGHIWGKQWVLVVLTGP
jgi:hypothetical protein